MNNHKQLSQRRLGSLPFMLVWTGGHILTWLAVYALSTTSFFYALPDFADIIVIGGLLGAGIALAQKLLIRYTFALPMRGWMRVSIVGSILGWAGLLGLSQTIPGFYLYPIWVQLLPAFLVPALLQWALLRRNTRQAWLWIATAAVSALTFGALYSGSYNPGYAAFALGASAQGAVTGLSLLWLFGMTGIMPPQTLRDSSRLALAEDEDEAQYEIPAESDDYARKHFYQG